jgi:hypothetical protein
MKRNSLFVLDNLEVKTPCSVSASNLISNKEGEWCKGCSQQVYDTVKHTKSDMAYLLFLKKRKVCLRIEKNRDGRIIYKSSLIKRAFNNLLYFTKCAVPASIVNFFSSSSQAQEHSLNIPANRNVNFSEVFYGDVRIRTPISDILVYIEGAFGALLMVLFFILFFINTVLSFFQKDKSKRKRKRILAIIFFILSVSAFILRSLVSVFFWI